MTAVWFIVAAALTWIAVDLIAAAVTHWKDTRK